jgi:hypothetical protein
VSFTDAPKNAKLINVNFGVSQPILYLLEDIKWWKGWAEDVPTTQHMGIESPSESPARSHWQARASTPVKNMKRNAYSMQESSDFSQASPSQKRLKLIEAAMAGEDSSDHSGPSITSPNATVNNARNISTFQPSTSGGLPFFSLLCL